MRWLPCRLCVCLLVAGATLRAQDLTSGAVGGIVTDATGRSVAHARVVITGGDGSDSRLAETGPMGEFLATHLAPGTVSLRVTRDGFAPEQVEAVPVLVGSTARIAVRLQVAGLAQSVTVQGIVADLPSLADSPLNPVLTPQELLALPIDGRRFQSFALLTPLVNLVETPGDTDAASTDTADQVVDADTVRLSMRGIDPSQNSSTQDGTGILRSYDGEPRGGALLPFTVPQEAVQEFQVRVTGAGTPFGRDAGGSVNAVTLRGEDTLHGSLFFLLRNSGVGASDPFALATRYNNGAPSNFYVKPRDQREQFGGSLGRTVPGTSARLAVFVAAEAQRRSFPGVSSPDNPNFFQLTSTQTALLANRGVSRAATARALNFLDSLAGEVPRHANEVALFPRVDLRTGARGTLWVTYTLARFDSPAGLREQTVVPRSRDAFSTLATNTDTLAIRWAQAITGRWLNEARVQASRESTYLQAPAPLSQEPQTALGGAVPQVTIDLGNSGTAGAFTFGTPASLQRRRLPQEKRAEFYDAVTFSGRADTVTLGLSGSLIDTAVETGIATNGAYQYSSGSTNGRAGGLVDFITDSTFSATAYPNGGCPSIFAAVHLFCFQSYTQAYGSASAVRFHTGEASAFLNEAWRPTPSLRIDVGARYEYFRMPLPQHANATLDQVFGDFASTNDFPGDPGNLAPHLAIAYSPRASTVVRLGYGIHFGRVTGRVLQQAIQNTAVSASTYQIRLTPRTEVEARCASAGTNFGYPATYNCAPTGAVARTSGATVFAHRFQLPMVQDAELSIEHGLGGGLTISGGYAMSLSRELPNTFDLNVAPATQNAVYRVQRDDLQGAPGAQNGSTFRVPLYTVRVSPFFGPVTAVLSNGNGTYHAGVVQLSRASAKGLTLRLAYTFSKALDNLRSTGASAEQNAQFDPMDAAYDKARSNYDRPHKVVANAVWSTETRLLHGFAHAAVSGWSFAPVLFATSGRPYSYLIEGGTSLSGGRDSINGSGGATYLPSVGRNTLRMPWSSNVDLRVQRRILLHERFEARLSAEAFNLFNRRNITAVRQRAFLVGSTVNGMTPLVYQSASAIAAEGLTTRPFGTPTSSANALTRERRLQFGLRLTW